MAAERLSKPGTGEKTGKARGASGRVVRVVASYGVAAVCLWWVFHDVGFGEVLEVTGGVRWWGPPAAIVLNYVVYLCVAWQWQVLLRPSTGLSFMRATQAVFAGRFANDVLPVHAGYVVRIVLVTRWTGVSAGVPVASLVVERLMEGFWLALGLAVVGMYLPLPGYITHSVTVLGVVVVGGAGAFVFLAWRRRGADWREGRVMRRETEGSQAASGPSRTGQPPYRERVLRGVWSFGRQVTDGIGRVSSWKVLLGALGISVIKLLVQALAFLSVLWAYGFGLSAGAQITVFLIAFAGISLPSTPAGVGVFQFACVLGLQLFGVPKAEATGFALLAFVLLTLPLAIAGFFAFGRSGLSLGRIRREELGRE